MARYTGPKSRIARRFGEPIFGPDKALDRRKYAPGQHGVNRRKKSSEYGTQLAEKQKAKYTYGVLERQFRLLFAEASRKKGITKVVNIPSFQVKPGMVVAVREKSKSLEVIAASLEGFNHAKYNWLEWNEADKAGKFLNIPPREEIPENIKEQLIVELYSKQ